MLDDILIMGKKSRQKRQKREEKTIRQSIHPSIFLAVGKEFLKQKKSTSSPEFDAACLKTQKQLLQALESNNQNLSDFPPSYVQYILDYSKAQGLEVGDEKLLELCRYFAKHEQEGGLKKGQKLDYYRSNEFLSSLWAEIEALRQDIPTDSDISEMLDKTEENILDKMQKNSGALTVERFELMLKSLEKELNIKIPKPYMDMFCTSYKENKHRLNTRLQIDAFLTETRKILLDSLDLIKSHNKIEVDIKPKPPASRVHPVAVQFANAILRESGETAGESKLPSYIQEIEIELKPILYDSNGVMLDQGSKEMLFAMWTEIEKIKNGESQMQERIQYFLTSGKSPEEARDELFHRMQTAPKTRSLLYADELCKMFQKQEDIILDQDLITEAALFYEGLDESKNHYIKLYLGIIHLYGLIAKKNKKY